MNLRTATRVVAWMDIIGSAICLILLGVALFSVQHVTDSILTENVSMDEKDAAATFAIGINSVFHMIYLNFTHFI